MADAGPALKTKFIYTTIPGMAPYKASDWSAERLKKPDVGVDGAKQLAQADAGVAFFFHAVDDFTLEKQSGTGTTYHSFRRGDSALYSDNLWLGTAAGKGDTYLLAEVYDTTDQATRDAVLAELKRHQIGGIDSSTATKASPRPVTAGIVYCSFKGGTKPDIPTTYQQLVGGTAQTNTLVQTFVTRESGGRVSLALAQYVAPGKTAPEWLELDKAVGDYAGDWTLLKQAVDNKIEFPDSWDIIVFVVRDAGWTGKSQCNTGQVVDISQKTQVVIVGPDAFSQTRGAAVTTAHELMHAFGLKDLYTANLLRSYGWSVMSDVKAAWHLTAWEKLSLGWEPIEDFVVLKRGLLPLNLVGPGATGTKGVIVLPDAAAGRTNTYVIEPAQEIGMSETDRSTWKAGHLTDPGLLVLMLRPDGKFDWASPFAYRRPLDQVADEAKYGGASLAPVPANGDLATNGIRVRSTPGYRTDTGATVKQVISVAGDYRPPTQASRLREGEKIASGAVEFGLTTTGALWLAGAPPFSVADGSCVLSGLYGTGFGHCFYVDRKGQAHLAKWHDATASAGAIIKSFDIPSGVTTTEGDHYFAIDQGTGTPRLAIYRRGAGGQSTLVYHLFQRAATVFAKGWTCSGPSANGLTLQAAHEPDWNVVVRTQPGGAFVAASTTTIGDVEGMPAALVISPAPAAGRGKLLWLAENGYVIKTTDLAVDGPYTIGFAGVSADLKKGSLVVKGAADAAAATILSFGG